MVCGFLRLGNLKPAVFSSGEKAKAPIRSNPAFPGKIQKLLEVIFAFARENRR